jgi:hypothetical protein
MQKLNAMREDRPVVGSARQRNKHIIIGFTQVIVISVPDLSFSSLENTHASFSMHQ